MTRLEGNQAAAGFTMFVPEYSFNGQNVNAGRVPVVPGGNGGNATPPAVTGANYAMWDFSPDLKFGLAVTAPFGLATDYADGWVGRYQGLRTEITDLNFQPSVAYQINEHLSIGLGWQISYFNAVLSAAINLPGLGLAPVDAKQTNAGNGVGFGGDIGFLFEVDPATRIGLNYRSRIHYDLKGGTSIQAPDALIAASPVFQNSGLQVGLTLPDMINLGFYHEFTPQLALMADVQFVTWSTIQELNFQYDNGRPNTVEPEHWRDTWFGSIGAAYALTPQSRVLVGVAYDESPVTYQTRTVRLPDTNRVLASFGFSYDLNPHVQANFGFLHVFTNGAPINQLAFTPAGRTLIGNYALSANIISVSAVAKF